MFRGLSVNPISGRVIIILCNIGCLLVRVISFPAAQPFVTAIENILRGCVGNLTSPYQSASRGRKEENKIVVSVLKIFIKTRFEKIQTLNIQDCRPDRSAVQMHRGLRLFLENILYSERYSTPLQGL